MITYVLPSLVVLLGFSRQVIADIKITSLWILDTKVYTGKPFTLDWTGAQGLVAIRLVLLNGSGEEKSITSGLHGTTYTWNPPASLNGQSGSLEISDGLTKDVSPQVSFRPGSEQGQNVITSSSITQSPFETNHPISFIVSSTSRNFEAFSTSTPVPTASGVSTSVSPSPHTRPLDESDNDFAPRFNTGAKVGIAIAITAVICLIGGAITFAFWYRKRSRKVKYGSNAKSMRSAKGFDINTSVEWKAELEAVSNVRHVSPVELDTEPLKLKR